MDNTILTCEVCNAPIQVDEEYYTVNVQLEKMDGRHRVFRGEDYPLYSVCANCASDVFLKGMVLSKDNKVSLTSDNQTNSFEL